MPALTLACAVVPYRRNGDGPHVLPLRPGEPRAEHGRPNRVVDGLGHYLFSLPSKLLLLSWHVENHRITAGTENALLEFLDGNRLCEVKVRINQYAPGGEWSRLARNREVSGFWRYSIGAIGLVFYTILPERLLGGDNYNPFTNTINLYSDEPAIALHEGGHAQDFAKRTHQGLYALLRVLPLVPLYQEGVGTSRAVSFLRDERESEPERKAYPLLWAAWGTYLAGEAGWFVSGPVLYLIQLPVAWGGRAVGWLHARSVPPPAAATPPELATSTEPPPPACARAGAPSPGLADPPSEPPTEQR